MLDSRPAVRTPRSNVRRSPSHGPSTGTGPGNRRPIANRGSEATYARVDGFYARMGKPTFDRAASAVLLVVLSPVLAFTAAALRLKLGKGVFLRQARVGRNGRVFMMCKFRTMLPDRRADERPIVFDDRRTQHKTVADPRHTDIGRFLRRISLDELPQLINVLAGEMSLVGPRPELEREVRRHDLWSHPRHLVRPGISGPWQLSDCRNDNIVDSAFLDIEYIEDMSLATDVKILVRTLLVPFRKTGS